jgi:glutathione S-transferase
MKLFYSPTSPYVRKVVACAIARGIDARIERVTTNPHLSPAALIAANPLSRVPCLVTDDGLGLFDSPVICEYLDSIGEAPPLFPRADSPGRWQALRLQALGDGMLDAAVARRMEQAKPLDDARGTFMARQKGVVVQSIAMLEAAVPGPAIEIGGLAIACALGYLDFRFAAEPWRPAAPQLAAWFTQISEHPALALTVPKDPT